MKRWLAPALALLLLLAACDPETNEGGPIVRTPTPRDDSGRTPLKIGLVGTMTGPEGWRGEDAFEGADLGVHHLNRRVGRNERPFELEVLDDGGDASRSLDLLESLLGRGETVGVVFAGPPEVLVDAEGLLRRARTPAVLVYGDLYGARALSSHVFQATPPYAWQARDIARYLARDRRYEKIGVLSEDTADGALAETAALSGLRGYGIDQAAEVTYQADVAAALERLQSQQVEAIVVQGTPSALERIYTEIRTMGARYRNTDAARVRSAPKRIRKKRRRTGWWHPQLVGFDLSISDRVKAPPPGSMATGTYARGAHLLPIPSFRRFRTTFEAWWDSTPRGHELRAYEATMALGWAAERSDQGNAAGALEGLRGKRFGGLPVTLGPDDHVMVEEVTIGLWTVPFSSDRTHLRTPEALPWVPLARGFSIDGERTDILTEDWRWLFRGAPPRGGPAPRFGKMRFGVTTPRSDPLR